MIYRIKSVFNLPFLYRMQVFFYFFFLVSSLVMFRLNNITFTTFKNYGSRPFRFTERIIGICGNNGAGKTNLLDGIHYLCFTKSYFTRDAINTQHGQEGFRIEGNFSTHTKEDQVVCILRETGKKEFLVNNIPYEKFSQHIGRYPCVIIAPDDAQLIMGGSEERRKFLDALLAQVDREYLEKLIVYNKVLVQRNSLLRSFAESRQKNLSLLDVLDGQLIRAGNFIFEKRKEFLLGFLPAGKRLYQEIARRDEKLFFMYESELLHASFDELLKAARPKDLLVQRTTSGIHRDELELNLGNQSFKNIASQGQRKSLLFALKLAELEVLKKEKKYAPLLLLDDVFEKLDEERVNNLLQKVCLENDGQVFITDTSEERLRLHLDMLQVNYQVIGL
jgi:DNA replication and repair protein RecF